MRTITIEVTMAVRDYTMYNFKYNGTFSQLEALYNQAKAQKDVNVILAQAKQLITLSPDFVNNNECKVMDYISFCEVNIEFDTTDEGWMCEEN